MKIGIFGDSFATKSVARLNIDQDYLSWVDYLSQKYNITNHSVSGSSLFYSYLEFMKHNSKYDKIVFLVTICGRLYLPHAQLDIHKYVPGYQHLLNYANKCLTQEHRLLHDTLSAYFMYIQNIDEERAKHRLLIKDIKKIRPDVLLIPCFDSRNDCMMPEYTGISLSDISMIDLKTRSWSEIKGPDYRHCHMNIENNKIFSEKVEQWITTETFSIQIEDFVKSSKSYEYYFK